MRVLVVTDAWHPQVNGVVRTLTHLAQALEERDVSVEFLTPNGFSTLPMPSYPEIRLALASPLRVSELIDSADPDSIHIATEGPLGFLARRHCLERGLPFTTSYHTRFPEIAEARAWIPPRWTYSWLRRFHQPSSGMLVATPSLAIELAGLGFTNIRPWTRGIDGELFHPSKRRPSPFPAPVFLCVGRVAAEKNLPAFLDLDLPGSKLIVGDGPELAELKARYPDAQFLGRKTGEELAEIYASADVFVFPSLLDTFGNVLLEAMASGCPVAAYPVTGPLDIVGRFGAGGSLSDNLRDAALAALEVPRETARTKALTYSWSECAAQFLDNLQPLHSAARSTTPRHSAVMSAC